MLEAYKPTLALIAAVISVLSFIPYFRDILRGANKPHAFSWLVWSFLTAIGFAAQVVGGAGAGAWATGITAFFCFIITGLAFKKGEKNITRGDWICLLAALAAIPLWLLTKGPLLSVILISIIDLIGFIPTIRKTLKKPHEETLSVYAISTVKFALAILALEHYSLVTWLYPTCLATQNAVFVGVIWVRRRREV